ncbi:MAG: RNA polymerase sigma factor [Bacteroidia bacterium]|nr:RNA polymerase sigma factor [Bacteroidia bacterium]NNJ56764.1 RNA polymerase sigma factor [Bacteroidia bacterium]
MESALTDIETTKALSKYTDNELIASVLETGDNVYFGELYDRYSDKVYGKCIQMVRDTDLAQDLAQDILVKAFLKLNTFKGNSNFGTWLYQVSYTHCIDYIRKNKKIFKEELEEDRFLHLQDDSKDYDETHDKILLEMKYEYIQKILFEIKAEERSLILQKYQDNLSIAELAEIYGASESAIKMKLKRTRDKIRERYYELNPENI